MILVKHALDELFDFQTGEYLKVTDFFQAYNPDNEEDQDILILLRLNLERAIQKQVSPIYGCWCCKGLAALRALSSDKRSKYFRAIHSPDCLVKQNNLSKEQILRIKYNGLQESFLHQTLKKEIAFHLELNRRNKKQVEEIIIDKRHNLSTDDNSKEWRKPDVLTITTIKGKKLKIAFELQITTTFLDVVVSRQDFYKRDESYIIWIFKDFDKDRRNQRMMQLDIVISNNKNAFVINEETKAKSIVEQDLVLLCLYKNYYRVGWEIKSEWKERFITLNDLTFDDNYLSYLHDAESQYSQIETEINKEKKLLDIQKQQEIEQQKIEKRKEQINSNIEDVVKIIRRAYYAKKDSDIPYWVKNILNTLEDDEVLLLNDKLKFETENSDFISNVIRSSEHNTFIKFLLQQPHIRLELNQPAKENITLLGSYIREMTGQEACIAIELFVAKGYKITELDRSFVSEKFPPGDVKGDFSIDNYFLNLIISLRHLEDMKSIIYLSGLRRVILALLSIKNDVFIDWGVKNYRGLANHILIKYEPYSFIFIKALKKYNKYNVMISEDILHKGNFRRLLKEFEAKNTTTTKNEEVFRVAFPELFR